MPQLKTTSAAELLRQASTLSAQTTAVVFRLLVATSISAEEDESEFFFFCKKGNCKKHTLGNALIGQMGWQRSAIVVEGV